MKAVELEGQRQDAGGSIPLAFASALAEVDNLKPPMWYSQGLRVSLVVQHYEEQLERICCRRSSQESMQPDIRMT